MVAPTSFSETSYFGGVLASVLRSRGVRGLIIYAGVRDVAELMAMSSPSCRTASTPRARLADAASPIQ
jgi:4-hydroxy-4-methyl-2-oxoglutarate aldolase